MQTNDTLRANGEKLITDFYLTGIRTDGSSELPNFYTFLLAQEGELRPLLAEGQVVFFTDPNQAETALQAAGIDAQFRSPLSVQNAYLIDVAYALRLLAHESADPEKIIANM